jgi:archaellum component FlaG (FlaF/FlaG flagellin family)
MGDKEMSLQIKGGLTGRIADVTLRNMLRTFAVSTNPHTFVTINDKRSWTVSATQTPTGANDYFFYLSNTGSRDIVMTSFSIQTGTIDRVLIQRVTGTPVGGTTLVPINRFVGSGRIPSTNILSAVDITGLTTAGTFERIVVVANDNNNLDLFNKPIVIPNGEAIALLAETGTVALTFQIAFYEQIIDPVEF